MGDQADREAQCLLELLDQFVELIGGNRIKPGGRFVQEQQFRVQRQRTRQTGAFFHAAGQFGRVFRAGIGRQSHQTEFHGGDLVHQFLTHAGIFAQRHLDVLRNGLGREQCPFLKQYAPAHLQPLHLGAFDLAGGLAEHFDTAFQRMDQPDDGAQQDRLAGARAADHAQHLAAIDIKIEVIVDDSVVKAVDQAPHLDDDVFFLLLRHQIPKTENMTEKAASITITRKMPSTTARVVSRPTLAALRST